MTLAADVLGPPAEDILPPLRHRTRARREHISTAMLLAPPATYFTLLFVVPLVVLLIYSFYTYQNFNFISKLTLANYTQALTSPARDSEGPRVVGRRPRGIRAFVAVSLPGTRAASI